MKNTNKIKKILLAGVVAFTSIAVLSGCGYSQLRPLPDEERYAKINAVKDELDYKSAGKVEHEKYDNGDGVFSPSYFQVNMSGEKTFETLSGRIENIAGANCSTDLPTTYRCNAGGVSIVLVRDTDTSSDVFLRITDSMNGRKGH